MKSVLIVASHHVIVLVIFSYQLIHVDGLAFSLSLPIVGSS